jgi:hypothetical protein
MDKSDITKWLPDEAYLHDSEYTGAFKIGLELQIETYFDKFYLMQDSTPETTRTVTIAQVERWYTQLQRKLAESEAKWRRKLEIKDG